PGQPADPGGRRHLRHVLRAGDDRRGHLHRGRQRYVRLRRRRRPGHLRRNARSRGGERGRRGEPGDRGQQQQPDPGGRHHLGHVLRQAMTAGDIYTVAGNGTAAFAGDGGPATTAELFFPNATTVDGAGNLAIADFYNNRIRVIAATSGTFYGQAMTAGDIYTVAGTGTTGYSGDGGPAVAANMGFPSAVAVDRSGNLVISLPYAERVRVVAVRSGKLYGQAMTAGDIYTVAGNGLVFESG